MYRYLKNYKQKVSITLKKTNSLTAKVLEMLVEDKYCIDIIQQNLIKNYTEKQQEIFNEKR